MHKSWHLRRGQKQVTTYVMLWNMWSVSIKRLSHADIFDIFFWPARLGRAQVQGEVSAHLCLGASAGVMTRGSSATRARRPTCPSARSSWPAPSKEPSRSPGEERLLGEERPAKRSTPLGFGMTSAEGYSLQALFFDIRSEYMAFARGAPPRCSDCD